MTVKFQYKYEYEIRIILYSEVNYIILKISIQFKT